MAYIPADETKWWQIKSLKEEKPVVPATGNSEYLGLIIKNANATPHYRGTQPIHALLETGPRLGFLYYIVTKQDLIPKNDDGLKSKPVVQQPKPR